MESAFRIEMCTFCGAFFNILTYGYNTHQLYGGAA